MKCEGCGHQIGMDEPASVTADDVWLCGECYESVPTIAESQANGAAPLSSSDTGPVGAAFPKAVPDEVL